MKKMRVAVPILVILSLLVSVMPVFACGPLECPEGTHEECTETGSVFVCDSGHTEETNCRWEGKWPWKHWVCDEMFVCDSGHEEPVVECSCVADGEEPGIPVTGGKPSWDWPNRTCADQGNCVAPEDAEYTIEEMKAPPAGTMYMIYTSADKFEWSYLDPTKNVLGPGIDGWFNNGNDRIYLVANETFSVVTDAGVAIPSAASDKVGGLQFLNAPTTGDLILLFGTFEGEFASADVDANRWRTSGITAGSPQRLVVEIDTCRGAFLD
jgi:hypothetical protein